MVAINQKLNRLPDGTIDIDAWLAQVKNTFSMNDITLIEKAVHLADETSKGLTTFYGQPCIEQGLLTATIILELRLDPEAVAASILYSAYDPTRLPIETIKKQLGEPVAKLIHSIQHMNLIKTLQPHPDKKRESIQIERLRKTILSMASDIRAVLIKLAQQMCLMRDIKNINPIERKRIAQETLDIYAPLANQLGIGQLKWELEDLAFHYTDPTTYKTIAKLLAERRVDREKRINNTISQLKEHLDNAHIHFTLSGRAKHIYSIYLKMQKKDLGYHNIYDSSAVRILVPTIKDCYEALSIVHSLWDHIDKEFDDYIANPKPNGYRSIHTAVIGNDGKHLEIQIRTFDMHEEAEHGVAAHWMYKENKPQLSGYENKIATLRQLLSWHKEVTQTPAQKTSEIFEDRVYAFTPAGDIIDMEKGATALDFAYHIHSELGHRCRGAKINGHIVPLTQPLRSGDRVDIITTPNGAPSRDWLSKESIYLKTARARAKVAQWFKHQDVTQYIEHGKAILEREFAKAGIHHVDLQKIAQHFNFKNEDALLSTLGHGSIRAAQIVHAAETELHRVVNKPTISAPHKVESAAPVHFHIAGVDKLLTRIALCCNPTPHDAIIGYITQGRGVSIHKLYCKNMLNSATKKDRLIQVSWDEKRKTQTKNQ